MKSVKTIILCFLCCIMLCLTSCGSQEKTEKPVIYLYPKSEQEVEVKLNYNGKLTCTYPDYKTGWKVTAKPDGTLINSYDRKEYSYLYWEGNSNNTHYDMTEGFIVKGEDTENFLREKLSYMGLKPKEYNEFIVYWLPRMKENKYNIIKFANKEYEKEAKLEVTPKPDSMLRVFMVFKPVNKPVKIKEQKLTSFKRQGFTVIEWGGCELK